MIIKSKYEIGQRVWVVYENKKEKEVCVYDDFIEQISVNEDGINYLLDKACEYVKEDEVILYEKTDKLVEKIKQITEK